MTTVEWEKWTERKYVYYMQQYSGGGSRSSQGGRQEFEIGVAYNKVGQKYDQMVG